MTKTQQTQKRSDNQTTTAAGGKSDTGIGQGSDVAEPGDEPAPVEGDEDEDDEDEDDDVEGDDDADSDAPSTAV